MVVLTWRLWLVHSNILVDTGQLPSDIPSGERKLRVTDLPGDAGLTSLTVSTRQLRSCRVSNREAEMVIIRASWQW